MSAGTLLRVLGPGFGVAVAIGGAVGSGILRTPGEVAAHLASPGLILLVWLAGGIYALVAACPMAELCAMTPRAGGFTAFVRRGLGPFPGFLVGWSDWLVADGSAAAVAIIAAESIARLVPAAAGRETAVAVALVLGLGAVQLGGVRGAGLVQVAVSALKVGAIVVVAGSCVVLLPKDGGTAAGAAPTLTGAILALQAVIFSYDGWYGVALFGGELRDPGRDAPRALFGTVLLLILLYVGLNAALVAVLPVAEMAGHPLAVGLAAGRAFGAAGETVLRLVVVTTALGGVAALQLGTPRILYALGQGSRLAPALGRVTTRGTPIAALAVSVAVEIVFILSGTFATVVAVLSVCMAANYALAIASYFALRKREPDAPRPYRAFGHPWTGLLTFGGALAFVIAALVTDRRNALAALVALAVSAPLFLLQRAK